MPETDSEMAQSVSVVVTRRQYGLYCWGLLLTFALLAVLIVVSVILLVEGEDAVLVLVVLIVLLLVVAAASFGFIEWQRRRAVRNRDQGAREWIHRTLSQTQLPTAPPESTPTSWAFWRKTSSTGSSNPPQGPQPSAPPQSARSSWVLGRKSYLPVSKAEHTVR